MAVDGGIHFYKMSGSGNDFVVFDAVSAESDRRTLDRDTGWIRRICSRGTGVGADGLVVLEPAPATRAAFRLRYFNADGSEAFCGNASLCATRLAVALGVGKADGFAFETIAGLVRARIAGGRPEIDLQPVVDVRPDAALGAADGERRIGFAVAGAPHLVVLCDSADDVDLPVRGAALRRDPSIAGGANVNFLSRDAAGGWSMRTFERGVEGETLACGSGATACAILLAEWGEAGPDTTLRTRSGLDLRVRLRASDGRWLPSLSGEGRIVFRGELAEL